MKTITFTSEEIKELEQETKYSHTELEKWLCDVELDVEDRELTIDRLNLQVGIVKKLAKD